ncbi:hypothetical protein VWZ88_13485 [Phaeobacter sp. JH20_36]|uniref:hypothetical protein n=1 Tax=Phaeobacter TaxID=302485 RepID=UPI0030C9E9D1
MNEAVRKSIAVFARPFNVPGFSETLPAGEYDIETELCSPPDSLQPETWRASVAVKLHPREFHPGLARTLTVSLADLDDALAKDKLTGKELAEYFLEEMLSDPMVRLVMVADGVSETQLRNLYSGGGASQAHKEAPDAAIAGELPTENSPIQAAENEGMPTQRE